MAEKVVILDCIRSAHNVGSIFRTSDGAGVTKIFLGGYTPTPVDRFGRIQEAIEKTSLGATETVLSEAVAEGAEAILAARLHAEGFTIVAIEQTPQSAPLITFVVPEKVAYIFGNEVEGVSETWLALADHHVEIPMMGKKESLNVSVCAGIVLFR